MKTNYLYCLNQDTCIHRRGCRRWIGNYHEEQAKLESTLNSKGYINDVECINEYELVVANIDLCGDPISYSYIHLDRFRSSTGQPFTIKE